MLIVLAVNRDGAQPIGRQLVEAVRCAIRDGRLAPGTRLPASRVLAREWRVGRNTVMAMTEQLVAEGFLATRPGAGTFVAAAPPAECPPPPSPLAATAPATLPALSRQGQWLAALPPPGQEVPLPFVPDLPALDAFPFHEWNRLAAQAWRVITPAMLAHPDPAGWQPLRAAIAAQISAARGFACTEEQVVVTSGASQALDLIARLLLDPGATVWIEDPGYVGARHIFAAGGARLVPVPVDDEGLDVAAGSRLAPSPRLIFVTPSRQYPLGVTMSPARRQQLLALAERCGAWIVEDDYDWEFRYAGTPLPALAALQPDGLVLHLGTYAKALLPGMRLGYLVLPRRLGRVFARAKGMLERHPPLVEQLTLHGFMTSGRFGAHLRRMRRLYATRQEATLAALRAALGPRAGIAPAETGMHLLLRLGEALPDRTVAAEAGRRGVVVRPLSPYYLGEQPSQGLLAGFAASPPERVELAARRLATAIDAVTTSPGA
ncbi:MocR-like pyridoxine biosynthesis transcription factor PdxR [Rhodovastum atsumiense]|uniref:MocR-like pyridoxine biosynthesis transcription factor PdxR n=1 Tax=Rhodovastum atsumiense TaxID=504468 RepID=UPI00193BE54B|nr:PLP-dependent aminotransferase family protein [Rhodovastum atsumiense]